MAVVLLAASVLLTALTGSASAMPAPFDGPAPAAIPPRQISVVHHPRAPSQQIQHPAAHLAALPHAVTRHAAVRHAAVRHAATPQAVTRHAAIPQAVTRHAAVHHAAARHALPRHAAATAKAHAVARPDTRQAALLTENTTYPPRQTCIATSSTVTATGPSSGRASISGSGFDPTSTVRVVTGATTLGSTTSDQAGGFVVAISAPSAARLVAMSSTCSAAVTPGSRSGGATPSSTTAPTDSPLAQGQLSISLPSTFFVLLVALAIVLAAVTLCVIAIRSGRRIQP